MLHSGNMNAVPRREIAVSFVFNAIKDRAATHSPYSITIDWRRLVIIVIFLKLYIYCYRMAFLLDSATSRNVLFKVDSQAMCVSCNPMLMTFSAPVPLDVSLCPK